MTESLRIKTYFATSIDAALALAKRELGPEAMLLNTRQSPAEARHLGLYEAVFALAPESFQQPPATAPPNSFGLEVTGLSANLLEQLGSCDPEDLAGRMEKLIAVDPTLARSVEGRQIAAFAGPPGRGKSTTLVKLAIAQGLAKRKPVRIFSADYLRIGAPAQLATLAGILGVPFEAFPSPAALDSALRQPLPGITLIDTPGFGPRDREEALTLSRCLSGHPHLDTHLVLSAESSAPSLAASIARFACFRPAKLLFTSLDEIASAGHIFSAAVQSKIPVSFLANGQSIPEDLEPASAPRLVELALGTFRHALLTAA